MIGQRYETCIAMNLTDGIVNIVIVVLIGRDTLVVNTHDHVRIPFGIFLLTCCIGLISDQRRFSSKDADIIDNKVVSVETRRYVIDTNTEMFVLLFGRTGVVNRNKDLIPSVRRLYIAGHIGRDVFPIRLIRLTLYGESEVRIRFSGLATRVSHIRREEHLLTRTQDGRQRESCYLTGGVHTVAVDHIALGCTAMLLHLIPIRSIRDAVDQTILTVVREVGLFVTAVMRQIRGLRIGITVRCIVPRKRVRINGVGRTGFIVIEVQPLQYIILLLDLIVGDQRFGDIIQYRLHSRSVIIRIVIADFVTADVEHTVAFHRFYRSVVRIAGEGRFPTACTQTIINRIHIALYRHLQEVIVLSDG